MDAISFAAPPVLPPPRRERQTPVVVALVLVLVAVVAAGVLATLRVRSADPGSVIAVQEPAPASAGWGATYVDERARPARWDPCTPVPYVVQAGWIPDNGRRDLAEALRRLSLASGLEFADEGDTDELPSRSRRAYQPERYGERWAPLLIAWVPSEATDVGLAADTPGVSISVAVPTPGGPSLVSGQVVLDATVRRRSGFGPGTTDGEVLLHELAHAVGLGHVLDPTQVMYTTTSNSESEFGAGDRAGLTALGAAAGCHPAPEAREVRTAS